MDVVSLCPLRTGALVWQPRRGSWVLTAVCKATYSLLPTEAVLAAEQEYPNDDENHWNDDPARSVYSPSDLCPFKPRADVMVVGHAFAPRKEPARSVVARILVGELNKAIEVWCDRVFTQDGSLREGPRFTRMPLRWERAAGGPETGNPVGVRADQRPDAYGTVQVPNLQPSGFLLSIPADYVEPVCFAPVAWRWPGRRERLGRHGASWSSTGWAQQPIPEDIDPGFFNAAPRDQQVEALRPNERIVLENLHPDHPRLATNLPGVAPRAFVERRGAAPQEVQMICDTLWIDTDRAVCTLTWRGQIPLDHPAQPGRVLVAMAEPGQRLSWSDVERMAAAHQPEELDANARTGELDAGFRPHAGGMEGVFRPQAAGPDGGSADGGSRPQASDGPRPAVAMPAGFANQTAPPLRQKAMTLPFLQGKSGLATAPLDGGKPRAARTPGSDPLRQTHDDEITAAGGITGSALPFGAGPKAARTVQPHELQGSGPAWLTQQRPGQEGGSRSQPPSSPQGPPPGSPFAGQSVSVPVPFTPGAKAPSFGPPRAVLTGPMPSFEPQAPPLPPPPAVVPAPSFAIASPVVHSPPPPSPVPPAPAMVMSGMPSGLGGAVGGPPPLAMSAPAPKPTAQMGAPAAPPRLNTANAASVGAAAASNAAAANSRAAAATPAASAPAASAYEGGYPPARSTTRPREVVDLLWFDPQALPTIRAHADWKQLLAALHAGAPKKPPSKALAFDDDEEEDAGTAAPPPPPPEVVDRRDVIAVLARGEPVDAEWLNEAILDAVDEDGSFTPPHVLSGGELSFPFDEVETLKVTVTIVKPLVGADKKLKEAVDAAGELLESPAIESSTGVAESLTSRIRDAFGQTSRIVPSTYLDTQTERMLLEQRHYQKRTVFGAPWVRALLAPSGGGAGGSVPVYLPEALAKQLPMFQRFRARLIAEAHLQQDQYESSPTALKVVAVARVMPLGITPPKR